MASNRPSEYLDLSLPDHPLSDPVFLFELHGLLPETPDEAEEAEEGQVEEDIEEIPNPDSRMLLSFPFSALFSLPRKLRIRQRFFLQAAH
jgi:hypothetical protein